MCVTPPRTSRTLCSRPCSGQRFRALLFLRLARQGERVPGQLPRLPRSGESVRLAFPATRRSSSFRRAQFLEFGGATRVYWTFKVLGHDAVTILDGGWRAWEAANGEKSAEAVAPPLPSGQFPPSINTTADVEKARETGAVKRIDGRPADQFAGRAKTRSCAFPAPFGFRQHRAGQVL